MFRFCDSTRSIYDVLARKPKLELTRFDNINKLFSTRNFQQQHLIIKLEYLWYDCQGSNHQSDLWQFWLINEPIQYFVKTSHLLHKNTRAKSLDIVSDFTIIDLSREMEGLSIPLCFIGNCPLFFCRFGNISPLFNTHRQAIPKPILIFKEEKCPKN